MDEEQIYGVLKASFKFDSFKSQLQKDAILEIAQSTYD